MNQAATPLTPRERRHQRTRQAILDAALELINQGGMKELSMRKIAERIDYSPAGLYEYFGSKEEIIAAACAQAEQRLEAYMKAVDPSLPPAQRLVELGMAYIRFAQNYSEQFIALQFSQASGQTELPAPVETHGSFKVLLETVQEAMNAGEISAEPYDVFTVAYTCWAFVHGMALLRLTTLKDVEVDFEPVNRWALEKYIEGLRTTS